MNKIAFFTVMFMFLTGCLSNAYASDETIGAEKTAFCERCHGVKGFTDNINMPIIAGQNKGYLVKQLKNYRKGIRKSAPMRQVMLTLSDEDIENLATYFSSIKISLKD